MKLRFLATDKYLFTNSVHILYVLLAFDYCNFIWVLFSFTFIFIHINLVFTVINCYQNIHVLWILCQTKLSSSIVDHSNNTIQNTIKNSYLALCITCNDLILAFARMPLHFFNSKLGVFRVIVWCSFHGFKIVNVNLVSKCNSKILTIRRKS